MHIRVLGDFDTSLLTDGWGEIERLPDCTAGAGTVPALRVIREQRSPDKAPVFVVTARDLQAPGLKTLFGLSDQRRQAAIVSTFQLQCDNRQRVRRRLENVMAHERGHLRGLRHCKTPGCLMNPAKNVDDLDARPSLPCPRCSSPRTHTPGGMIIAALACILAIMGLDACAMALKSKSAPFSWRPLNGRATVFYQKQPVAHMEDIPGTPAAARAESSARALNTIFRQLNPAPFAVSSSSPGRAAIVAGGTPVIEFTTVDAEGGDPREYAHTWLLNMEPILRGKGTADENCQDCHVRRLAETERWSRELGKGRK